MLVLKYVAYYQGSTVEFSGESLPPCWGPCPSGTLSEMVAVYADARMHVSLLLTHSGVLCYIITFPLSPHTVFLRFPR